MTHRYELLHRPPHPPRRPVDLLFVHGAWTGAWVWERWLDMFAARGYGVRAVSLRGYGASPPSPDGVSASLSDYADDVGWALNQGARPTVVIGHSLGGAAAQRRARRTRLAGMVLLASAPPFGLTRASLAMLATRPKLWTALLNAAAGPPSDADAHHIIDALFATPPAPALRRRLMQTYGAVSPRAAAELMHSHRLSGRPWAPHPWAAPPTLIVGGDEDVFVPPTDVVGTALYYNARAHLLKNVGHAIMLEKAGDAAVDVIDAWLRETFAVAAQSAPAVAADA